MVVEERVFTGLRDGALMGWFRGQRVVCPGWSDGLAARLEWAEGRWRPWAPNWDLLDAKGETDEAEAAEYVRAMPASARRLAGRFPRRQWLALDALRHVPGFAVFLDQEIAAAGLSFVLLCWEVSHAQYRPSAERHALATAMMSEKRAALLARLTDAPFTDRHLRLLAKLRLRDVDKDLVWELLAAGEDRIVVQELSAAPRIGTALLHTVAALPDWLRPPALLRLMAAGDVSPDTILAALQPLLDADTVLRPRIRAALATVTGWADLARLADRWRRVLRATIAFPLPPIPGTERLVPIHNGLELEEEGRLMGHCVANYTERALRGECAYYRWLGEERATVQFDRRPEGWQVAQQLGPGNRPLSPATVAAIWQVATIQLAARPAAEPLPLDTHVAGAPYYQAPRLFDRLRPGQILPLRRQPANPHDPLAIEVLTAEGDKLGYLPRQHNHLPATLMDQGEVLEARITAARGGLDIRIRVERQPQAVEAGPEATRCQEKGE